MECFFEKTKLPVWGASLTKLNIAISFGMECFFVETQLPALPGWGAFLTKLNFCYGVRF